MARKQKQVDFYQLADGAARRDEISIFRADGFIHLFVQKEVFETGRVQAVVFQMGDSLTFRIDTLHSAWQEDAMLEVSIPLFGQTQVRIAVLTEEEEAFAQGYVIGAAGHAEVEWDEV